MARLARVVVPGMAHHVTQRGNRRERVFFGDEDYRLCLAPSPRSSRSTGRPVGAGEWLAGIEAQLRRPLAPAKPGRKPKRVDAEKTAELFSAVSP